MRGKKRERKRKREIERHQNIFNGKLDISLLKDGFNSLIKRLSAIRISILLLPLYIIENSSMLNTLLQMF